MNTKAINIRIDEDLKKESQEIFNNMGLTLSGGIKLILKNLIKTKKIPELTENGFSLTYEKKILKEFQEIKKIGKVYSNFSEILNEVDDEIKKEKNI